jgi:uncharacterized protein (DUF924 family)
MDLWFGKDDKTDVYIDAIYGNMVLGVRGSEYNHWISSPMATLALVILLDQFPRNIFRHSPDMFSCDLLALLVVTQLMYYLRPPHQRLQATKHLLLSCLNKS